MANTSKSEVDKDLSLKEIYLKNELPVSLEELQGITDLQVMDDSDSIHVYNDSTEDNQLEQVASSKRNKLKDSCKSTDEDIAVLCPICKRMYKTRVSLTSHLRKTHNFYKSNRNKMPCLETGCNFRTNRIVRLITHLIRTHKLKFQCEKVTFQQKEDFFRWKEETEERCKSSYASRTSVKRMVSGNERVFYICRRSGYATSQDSEKAHPQRAKKGSMKINGMCTSFMEVTFLREGGATVYFCKTHYGHEDDGFHQRMNSKEKTMITDLIRSGYTIFQIIEIMKTKMPLHRHQVLKQNNIRHLAAKQNLFITRSYRKGSVKKLPGKFSVTSDVPSISLQVENETEVEAELPETVSTNVTIVDVQDIKTEEAPKSHTEIEVHGSVDEVEKLRNEIQMKIERISRLTVGLVSENALRQLCDNLDDVTRMLETEKHIEVISENCECICDDQQNVILHEDVGGNSVLLYCSDKNIEDLVQEDLL